MIKPTVGRVMWYRPQGHGPGYDPGEQPLAAIVTHVWSDHMVNLAVMDANGTSHSRTSVPVIQDGSPYMASPSSPYCEWMPYQVGQAKKHGESDDKATLHSSTFEYLKPTDAQFDTMTRVRAAAKVYAEVIDKELPGGPDKDFVLRQHRETAMWANIAITRLPDGTPRT